MFKQYAQLKSKLNNNFCEIELEVRKQIQKPANFKPTEEYTLVYYKSDMYPAVTFRAFSTNLQTVYTKEVIKSSKYNNFKIVLSAEDSSSRFLLKTSLQYMYSRKLRRQRLQTNPIVEITESEDNGYMLEIEFDEQTADQIPEILSKWKYPCWPASKPYETTSKNIARILYSKDWLYSPKADGEHVLIYEDQNLNKAIIHDNGNITDEFNNSIEPLSDVYNVYEAELINTRLYVFDCLILMRGKIGKRSYILRRAAIPSDRYYVKEIYDTPQELMSADFDYPIDGYIIQHIKNNIKYKSKFKATVDLRYIDNRLYLEGENTSSRICNLPLDNYKIYEFDLDLNLIKKREDKLIANYKFPYENNPLEKAMCGQGVPFLRNFHNNIKEILLERVHGTLLDIGSGAGGDLSKWGSKTKVYAVDPEIQFERNDNVITIKDRVENVYEKLEYDSVSILFVPWNNKFFDIIKGKTTILALLQKPIEYECDIFTCKIEKDLIKLHIPDSRTAENIEERIAQLPNSFKKYELKFELRKGTKEEQILQKMYKYYFIP